MLDRGGAGSGRGATDEKRRGGLASLHGPSGQGGGVAVEGASAAPVRTHRGARSAPRSPTPRRTVVEIVVTGRHTEVPERFRRHLEEKLAKVTQLAPRVQRLDVVISHEPNRRQSKACDRVEITCLDRGPVVRAEACADDPVRRTGHGDGQAVRAPAPDARPQAGPPRPARARGPVRGLGASEPGRGPGDRPGPRRRRTSWWRQHRRRCDCRRAGARTPGPASTRARARS